MAQILVELIKMTNLIITISKSLACAKRIQNIFEIHSSQVSGVLQLKKRSLFCSLFGFCPLDGWNRKTLSVFRRKPWVLSGFFAVTGSPRPALFPTVPAYPSPCRPPAPQPFPPSAVCCSAFLWTPSAVFSASDDKKKRFRASCRTERSEQKHSRSIRVIGSPAVF